MVKTYSKARDGKRKLSRNFTISEFACKDGTDTILIDVDVVRNVLQPIRRLTNKPLVISSAYRTKSYNAKIGGVVNSYHTKGRAFDIYTKALDEVALARVCELLGASGIGCYRTQKFVHCDSRDCIYKWYDFGTYTRNIESFANETIVKNVQTLLNYCYKKTNKKDYDCGQVDGIIGKRTVNAFRFFCLNNKYKRKQMRNILRGD